MIHRRFIVAAVAATAFVGVTAVASPVPSVSAFAPPDGPVFINEIHYDNAGTDAGEAIEIAGPAGTDLTGWSLVLYNGSGGAPYDTDSLSGVLTNQAGGAGTTSISYPSNGIQNGAPDGVALVNAAGGVEQFLSYEGRFTAVGGPANGITSTNIGVSQNGTEPAGSSLALIGEGATYGDFTWTATTTSSFGQVNPGQTFDGVGGPPDPPPPPPPTNCPAPPMTAPIGTVQGTSDITPCGGETVTIEGVVVGDYEGPQPALRGFYLQQADGTHDGDPDTSEGIFVFNFNNDSVELGDQVRVTGTAGEFQGQTQISSVAEIVEVASDRSVTPAAVSLPLTSQDQLESVEGMLVRFDQTLAVTEHFQLGRFGQIVVSSDTRLAQPTNVVEPGAEANALQMQNNLDRLIIDDAFNSQNRDPIVLGRGGQPLSATNTLRGGDTVTGATGVLTYTWAGNSASGNAYRLRVEGDLSDSGLAAGGVIPDFHPANPRPDDRDDVGGSLQVANLNVLNYFLTIDAGANRCGPVGYEQDCRGADTDAELQRQRTKLLEAIAKIDSDVVGLVELENTTGVEPLADIVDGLNAAAGPGTYDYIETGTVGTDVIKVGIIFRPSAVRPEGEFAVLDSGVDPGFDSDRNRASLAQSFVENDSGEVVTVVVNHLKSKGCGDATGADADQGDGQGCWNATRASAAEALVDWVAGYPTGIVDDDVMIAGDLNSYANEDPIDVLAAAGYVDLGATFGDGYSYVFNGQWGTLDYAMASASLFEQVTGAAEYHINADEPNALDYNTEFKSVGHVASLYAPDEFRVSDHDPLIAGLSLDANVADAVATPDRLWPPNHKYRTVLVTAGDATVTLYRGTSSEADSGLGPDDRPNDIVLRGGNVVDLRAERYAMQGRTYTLFAEIVDGGQTVFDTATVHVPLNRRG
ncbi:MAG: ExeM/NucH family extracellular endonuclease [Actinomycetota bacterium]|nr:ExeM/NucH family extracellular endonuclease [Actinomycetota bacterium]